jgi:GH24 family phage-related lysozyme (muramidase)
MSPFQQRIQNLQKTLKTAETGIFDVSTANACLKSLGIQVPETADFTERKKSLQRFLGFKGNDVDGIVGTNTLSRLEMLYSKTLPPIPIGASLIASKRSLDVIVEFEVSSKTIYERKYKSPILPGEYSGITIGIGYDLGYVTSATFANDWKGVLSNADFNTLLGVVGKSKIAAKNALTEAVKRISIEWDAAIEVFYTKSMPIWSKKSRKIYPGLEKLPPDVQGSIVSLVYNRGDSLGMDDRRLEMRNLVQHIASGKLKSIAEEIRKMKRLWSIQQSAGLHRRRDREADLVENANFIIKPEDCVFV